MDQKHCHIRASSVILVLMTVMVPTALSLPRYSVPHLLQPQLLRPSPVHHFNFVANGHPYKITVNNKELQPRLPLTTPDTQSPAKPNKPAKKPVNSPITWITSPIGFNGIPVNIISYPRYPLHTQQVNRVWGAPSGLLT